MSTNTHDTEENNVKAPLLGVQTRQHVNYQATEGHGDSSAQPGQEAPEETEKSVWIIMIGWVPLDMSK